MLTCKVGLFQIERQLEDPFDQKGLDVVRNGAVFSELREMLSLEVTDAQEFLTYNKFLHDTTLKSMPSLPVERVYDASARHAGTGDSIEVELDDH